MSVINTFFVSSAKTSESASDIFEVWFEESGTVGSRLVFQREVSAAHFEYSSGNWAVINMAISPDYLWLYFMDYCFVRRLSTTTLVVDTSWGPDTYPGTGGGKCLDLRKDSHGDIVGSGNPRCIRVSGDGNFIVATNYVSAGNHPAVHCINSEGVLLWRQSNISYPASGWGACFDPDGLSVWVSFKDAGVAVKQFRLSDGVVLDSLLSGFDSREVLVDGDDVYLTPDASIIKLSKEEETIWVADTGKNSESLMYTYRMILHEGVLWASGSAAEGASLLWKIDSLTGEIENQVDGSDNIIRIVDMYNLPSSELICASSYSLSTSFLRIYDSDTLLQLETLEDVTHQFRAFSFGGDFELTPDPTEATPIDEVVIEGSGSARINSTTDMLALRFRAARSYFPTHVAFCASRNGSVGTVTINLCMTDSDRQPGAVLASTAFDCHFFKLGVASWVAEALDKIVLLEEGNEYVLTIQCSGASGAEYLDVSFGDVIARLGENSFASADSGDSWTFNRLPLLYAVYGDVTMSLPIVLNDAFLLGKKYSYPFVRRLEWRTDIVTYDSQIDQSNQRWSTPKRSWTLPYELLSPAQRAALQSFFERVAGRYNTFLFKDPEDHDGAFSVDQLALPVTVISQPAGTGNDTFTVVGKLAKQFPPGRRFLVDGSTGNDGTYTVVESYQTYDTVAGTTVITVEEAIPSAVVDGDILFMEFDLTHTYNSGETGSFVEYKKDLVANTLVVTVDGSAQVLAADYTCVDTDGVIKFESGSVPVDGATIAASFEFYYRVRCGSDSMSFGLQNALFSTPNSLELQEVKRLACQT